MNTRRKGNKFEDKVQKCINSGAFYFDKGDLKTEDFLIECKYTEKGSYSVNKKLLNKIWGESLNRNKLPKLVIGIKEGEKVWILDCSLYKEAS